MITSNWQNEIDLNSQFLKCYFSTVISKGLYPKQQHRKMI